MSFSIGAESLAESAICTLAEYITWMSNFLIVLASATRKVEVNFFDYSKVHLSSKWSSVTQEL